MQSLTVFSGLNDVIENISIFPSLILIIILKPINYIQNASYSKQLAFFFLQPRCFYSSSFNSNFYCTSSFYFTLFWHRVSRNTVQNASVKIRHLNVILMKLLQIDEGVLWVADGTPGNTPADLSRRQGNVKFRVSVEIALLEGVRWRSGEWSWNLGLAIRKFEMFNKNTFSNKGVISPSGESKLHMCKTNRSLKKFLTKMAVAVLRAWNFEW